MLILLNCSDFLYVIYLDILSIYNYLWILSTYNYLRILSTITYKFIRMKLPKDKDFVRNLNIDISHILSINKKLNNI